MMRAIATRDMIGQAKGMLMERFNIDADRAFGLLTRLSQETDTRVESIARNWLIRRVRHVRAEAPAALKLRAKPVERRC